MNWFVSSSRRSWAARGLRAGLLAMAGLLGLGTTGCGVMSALVNPKAGWALQEPAPMSVILRRAEVANAVAHNVERLLGETGVNPKSKWTPKLALKKEEAEALLKEIGNDPIYVTEPPQKLRVIAAEVWADKLAAICSNENKQPSLIAAVGEELAAAYADVAGQSREIGKLKAARAEEEKELEKKDISASDKEEHEKKKAKITEDIAAAEQAYRPKVEALLSKIRDEAGKTDGETKKNIGIAVLNLRRAANDAKLANSVALLRYPLAMPNMPQEMQTSAKRIAADVVEDKTGHRPTFDGFKPDVKLEGGSVQLSLNGIPVDKLGGLKPPELVLETTERMKNYVKRILTLLADVDETQNLLTLEIEVLDALVDGMKLDAESVKGAGDDLAEIKVETAAAPGAAGGKAPAKQTPRPKGKSRGVAVAKCPENAASKKAKGAKDAPKGKKPSS